ncbi:hypothetical protein [Streptomyces sp. UNOB3_S3]|uniref:hypothetical protein n=1 Tax=Streptomyces sp. UNOB3_S3 TaxID=2871682 RepID=UPI001E4CC611|nr:hypothetical protein [Streptomyces sp. UNOB3_S3]MCC3775007.1 hypothetical protein [Streptomyces sp. UNOB3_S3]
MVNRRVRAATLAAATAGSAVLALLAPTAGAASAATAATVTAAAPAKAVRVLYTCSSPRNPQPEDHYLDITVTAPRFVERGDDIALAVSLRTVDPPLRNVPARDIKAQVDIAVGGAGRGTVQATGLTNTEPVEAGKQALLTEGRATVEAQRAGTHTFRAGQRVLVQTSGYAVDCVAKGASPVAARTTVRR